MAAPRNVKKAKRQVLCEKCGQGYDRTNKSDIFCPDCKTTQPQYSIQKTCTRCGNTFSAYNKYRIKVSYCQECAKTLQKVNLSIVMDKAKTVHTAPRMRNSFRKGNSVTILTTV